MAVYNSVEELEKAILARCKNATDYATEWSKMMIEMNKQEFYNEYTPIEYTRTGQLQDCLDRTGVKPVGKGFEAEAYFHDDWDYIDTPDDRGWTTDEIVSANMHGGHPQWKNGTHKVRVWDDSMADIEEHSRTIARDSLTMAGLPVE